MSDEINAMLNTGITASQINVKDPFMAELALNRIKNLSEFDSLKAEQIATQLFNDISIKYLLDNSNEDFLSSLFYELPAKLFLNNINTLILRWPDWTDTVACWLSPVIAQLNPKQAYKLFSSYLELNSASYKDSNKFFGIVESLKYLQDEDSKNISYKLIDTYLSLLDDGKLFFAMSILEIAWELNHPEFNNLLRQFIISSSRIREVQFMQDLSALSHLFAGSCTDYNFIIDHYDGYTKQKYASIPLFFKESSPLAGIDNAIESIKRNDYKNIEQLFQENRDSTSHSKLRDLLKNLLNDKNITNALDKKEKLFFYSFILGCLVTSLRRTEIDLKNLSLKQVADILSADIEEIPSFNTFVTFLRGKNKKDVVQILLEAFNRNINNYGGSHVIDAMGELGYDDFLEPLTRALFENNDYIFLAAERALLGYGDKTIDCIKRRVAATKRSYRSDGQTKKTSSPKKLLMSNGIKGNFDNMKEGAYAPVLSVVKKIGGLKAVQFLDDFFEDLWREDKKKLLNAIETIPDERFIKRLEPYTNKGQFMIDHTYIVLSKLYNQETPEVNSLTEKFFQHAKEEKEYSEANEQGRMSDAVRPYIDLALKCKSCGDQCVYRVKEIIVSHIQNSKPFIIDEIKCVNCSKVSEFDLTPQSYGTLTGEIARFNMLYASKEGMEALKKSPVKFMSINVKGEEMGLQEGIQAILGAIAKDPANSENYISLGYLYHNIKRYSKAEEYYKKAIEYDPSYIEPYYFLAIIADKRKENEAAFQWVQKGSLYIETAKYRQDFEIEKAEFGKIYADLYNDLMRKTRIKVPLLHPGAFSGKVRRNDPCPCGSGKKYKKCCMK